MKYKQIIDEVLASNAFKSVLRDNLAKKISAEYHFEDSEGVLIKKEVRQIIANEAKTMIKELVSDYYELDTVRDLIDKALKDLTKKEILDFIKEKVN